MQAFGLQYFHAHRGDNAARILVHNRLGSARKLDPVAMHDESNRRAVHRSAIKAVKRLARNITGITAVADDPGALAEIGALA